MEDLNDFLASDRLSEKIELLLLLSGMDGSAKVAALPKGRCRSPGGGGLMWRDVPAAKSGAVSLLGEAIVSDAIVALCG